MKVISYDGDAAQGRAHDLRQPADGIRDRRVPGRVDRRADRLQGRHRDPVGHADRGEPEHLDQVHEGRRSKLPKYKDMKLVKIAYGNDNPTDSAKETQALLQAYPNLKGIISPTTVGISSAAQVLDQAGQVQGDRADRPRPAEPDAQVREVGLREEVRALERARLRLPRRRTSRTTSSTGKLTGKIGQTFKAGRLGKRTVVEERRERARGRARRPARLHAAEHRQVPLLGKNRAGRARSRARPDSGRRRR